MLNPLITTLQLLRPIPEGDQELIASYFGLQACKEGTILFPGGRICREMYFVIDGVLRITVTNAKEIDVTHFFVKENQFCTILNSFNNQVPAQESIQAACDTEVLAIPRSRLLELYKQLPYVRDLIDQITQQRLLDKIQLR